MALFTAKLRGSPSPVNGVSRLYGGLRGRGLTGTGLAGVGPTGPPYFQLFFAETLFTEMLEFASAQPVDRAASSVPWSDRAPRRKSASGASATEQQRRDPHTSRAQRARGMCPIVHLFTSGGLYLSSFGGATLMAHAKFEVIAKLLIWCTRVRGPGCTSEGSVAVRRPDLSRGHLGF